MPNEDAKTLGRLEEAVDQLAEQSRALFRKSDEAQAQLAGLTSTVEHVAGLLKDVRDELKDLRGKVSDLQYARARSAGFLAAVTCLGGGAGALGAKLLGLLGSTPPGH